MEGFKELRKHNIIHRDIKPENIFKDGETYKIGDLGLARTTITKASMLG